MSDTLEIFGIEYTDVTGIVATDDNGNDLTYTRGGIDAPTFTVIWDDNWAEPVSATCDKTYAECKNYYNSGTAYFASTIDTDQSHSDQYMAAAVCLGISYGTTDELIEYSAYTGSIPYYDILMYSNGTITITYPSAHTQTLNITQNGTIRNYDYFYDTINVNVPSSGGTYQTKTVTPTTSQQTVTPDSEYDALSSVTVNAMPTGTATAPTSISGTAATVSTGTNTLTLTKTVSVTPRITTSGYVSTGTAGNASVSLTASVTTKAAATITPGTTNQTIASGTYLTGTQTIAGDADLVGSNILSTASIFGVQGTVVVQNYYTGSSAPSSSLGSNGDLYLQS